MSILKGYPIDNVIIPDDDENKWKQFSRCERRRDIQKAVSYHKMPNIYYIWLLFIGITR